MPDREGRATVEPDAYAQADAEPPLEEVLRDPIVRLVIRRDGLDPADVRRVIDAARRRLGASVAPRPVARRQRCEAAAGDHSAGSITS